MLESLIGELASLLIVLKIRSQGNIQTSGLTVQTGLQLNPSLHLLRPRCGLEIFLYTAKDF